MIPRAFFATLLVLTIFSSACRRTPPKQAKQVEKEKEKPVAPSHDLARRVQLAVERAGGSQVWVKSAVAGAPREVLAVDAAYDAAVDAIRNTATAEGLKAQVKSGGEKGHGRTADIALERKGDVTGRWRVREVPRLLRAAIIIDDMGQDLEAARKLIHQPYALTFSVLPDLPHSAESAREAHAAGRAVMLHLPMEPEPAAGVHPGPGEISVGMRGDAVAKTIRDDLGTVPFAEGVNNHMGSRATADAPLMDEVMQVLASRGLFFIDSRTTAETSALNEARRHGLPAFYRSVFLDDTETVAYTLGQLRTFRRTVQERGVAVAIGHPHATTIEALTQFLPEFAKSDIQLIPASQIVRLPEIAHLDPPSRGPNVAQEKSSSHY